MVNCRLWKTDAAASSVTSLSFYWTTRRHMPPVLFISVCLSSSEFHLAAIWRHNWVRDSTRSWRTGIHEPTKTTLTLTTYVARAHPVWRRNRLRSYNTGFRRPHFTTSCHKFLGPSKIIVLMSCKDKESKTKNRRPDLPVSFQRVLQPGVLTAFETG